MQRRLLTSAVTALAAAAPGASTLAAQEVRQHDQAGAAVMVPAYTDLQRWNRVAFHAVNFLVTGIAHAKARGERAEDYGRFIGGERFAPTAGAPNTGYALRMARAIFRNLGAFPGSEAQIVSASDTSATVRYRRFHVQQFGQERQLFGVTLDEYDRANAAIHQRMAEYLGLRYEERVDGDWNVVTIRGRGNAAVVDFPRATYVVTISQDEVPRATDAVGTWELSFGPDGRYTVRHNGDLRVRGTYKLRLDEIAVGEETGSLACPGPGTYRWMVDARGELVLLRLSDACDGRGRLFTWRPMRRK